MAWCASALFSAKFEKTFAPVIFSVILLLYLFGLLDALTLGFHIVRMVGIASFLFCVYMWIRSLKNADRPLKLWLTPGFFIFLFFSVIIFYTTYGKLFVIWDEFSHWGLTVKNMFHLQAFGSSSEATTFFKGYPPAISLFQYFFVMMQGVFSEGSLLRASATFSVALLLPIFSGFSWRQWKILPPLVLLLLCFIFLFSYTLFLFTSIIIDGILALLIAYILFLFFSQNKNSAIVFVHLGLACAVLALTKPSGKGLVIIVLLICLCDAIRTGNASGKLKKTFFLFLIPLAFILFATHSWDFHLRNLDIHEAWANSGGSFTLERFLAFIRGTGAPYQYVCLQNFVLAFIAFSKSGFVWVSYPIWIAVFAALGAIMHRMVKPDQKRTIIYCTVGVILGFIAYSISMLLLYVFAFLEYEAVELASFVRYMDTYILGGLVFMVYMLIWNVKHDDRKTAIAASTLCLVLVLATPLEAMFNHLSATKQINDSVIFRTKYMQTEFYNAFMNPAKDRVWVVEQNSIGDVYWKTKYHLTPVHINPLNTWSLGAKYGSRDEWTTDISAEAWSQMLYDDYTYVYVYQADERFANEYGHLFDGLIHNQTLYKIEKALGKITLCTTDH